MNCVADDLHRRPLADRGSPGRTHGNAVTNPRIRVCSTVVLTALSPALRNGFILPCPVLRRDRTRSLNVLDNEHQSSCAQIGSRTTCSNPTTISSITAATPGTPSSISPGRSCPSPVANGQPSVSHCEDWYKGRDFARPLAGARDAWAENGRRPPRAWLQHTSHQTRLIIRPLDRAPAKMEIRASRSS